MTTVLEVAAVIRDSIDAPTRAVTVDGILAGDPQAEVREVAVVTMATLAALRQAADAGANLVVTHEPLFFDHHDGAREALAAEDDPVYETKRAFLAASGLAVIHLHDQWHDLRPDGVDAATAAELGWTLDGNTATIASITLGALAQHIAETLGATALRFIGDPTVEITRVGLDLGFRGFARNRALLRRPDVDVAIVGEMHEWETGEYAADAATAGVAKGLIVVGHVPSEAAGSRAVAAWLPGALSAAGHSHIPVTYLDAPDLFSRVGP